MRRVKFFVKKGLIFDEDGVHEIVAETHQAAEKEFYEIKLKAATAKGVRIGRFSPLPEPNSSPMSS